MQTSSTTFDITTRAMLVDVSISALNVIKSDTAANKKLAQDQGNDPKRSKVQKELIAKERIKAVYDVRQAIRSEHYSRTLPWANDGARIMSNQGYFAYAEFMREAESRYAAVVEEFLSAWAEYVEEAKVFLGKLFNQADYPSVEKLRGKFGFKWDVYPVPVGNDFRVELSTEASEAIRERIESTYRASMQAGQQEVYDRIQSVCGAMVQSLREYDQTNKGKHPFRDSLVLNVSDLIAVLPSINFTGSPLIASITEELQKLTVAPADVLRQDPILRENIASEADAILSQLSAFIA